MERTRSHTLSFPSSGRPLISVAASSMARETRSARRSGSITLAGGNGCSRVDGGTRSSRHWLFSVRSRAAASPRLWQARSLTSRSSARSRPFSV